MRENIDDKNEIGVERILFLDEMQKGLYWDAIFETFIPFMEQNC